MTTKLNPLDQDQTKPDFEAILNKKNQNLEEILEFLFKDSDDNKTVEKIIKETREMIPQIDERIHYWENRRTQFLQLALGILAAAIAGILAIAPQVIEIIEDNRLYSPASFFLFPVLVLTLLLVSGSTKILIIWNKQNNPPYPFTQETNIWRWQYRYAEKSFKNDTDFTSFNNEDKKTQADIFAINLLDYKISTLGSSKIELLDQDLSQLYLLLINEKFKIKFVSKLRDTLMETLLLSGVFAIAILLILGLGYILSIIE